MIEIINKLLDILKAINTNIAGQQIMFVIGIVLVAIIFTILISLD